MKITLTETDGDFCPPAEELFAQVSRARALGCSVAIHAVDESAVCLAMEAIAAALGRQQGRHHSHRIEHASVVPPALREQLAALGIAVATQPGFLFHSGDRYLADVDEHLQPWLYPIKSLLASGVLVAAGSDAPVAPAEPLRSIQAAVTRRSRQGQVVGAEERISVEQALRLHTVNPAKLLGLQRELGSIARGKRADLVLLDANPLETSPDEITDIRVEMTVVAGQVAFDDPRKEG